MKDAIKLGHQLEEEDEEEEEKSKDDEIDNVEDDEGVTSNMINGHEN